MNEPVRKVTLEEFHAEAKAQGVPRDHVSVKCFMCDTVQSLVMFIAAVGIDKAEGYWGFSCIGRFRRALPPDVAKGLNEGCNWTLGGLFCFSHYIIITPDGKEHNRFPLATREEAQKLYDTRAEIET